MPFRSALRPLVREAFAGLLSALLLLSVLAGARLDGVKAADTARLGVVSLCVPSGGDEGKNPDPDHDCGLCCLPNPLAHRVTAFAQPFVFAPGERITRDATSRAAPVAVALLPWSRGPPA